LFVEGWEGVLGEEVEVGAFAKEVGVIGGDEIDDDPDFLFGARVPENVAVLVERLEAELNTASTEATGDQFLFMRTEVNAAVPVDEAGQVFVGGWGDAWVCGH
jgi:hypothetical protein